MSAFQEKPGYCVWGMQNEDESNEDKVRELSRPDHVGTLQAIERTWIFTLNEMGSLWRLWEEQ